MNMRKILVPIDFSSYSLTALEHATTIARDGGAMLVIVHVHEPHSYVDGGFAGVAVDNETVAESKMLGKVRPTEPDVGFAQRLFCGKPADEIVRCAEEEGVDMIVMGTHGRRGLSRLLMGSVSEAVIRRAPCPVLTINLPHREMVEAT